MRYSRAWRLDGEMFVGLTIICLGVIFLLGNIYPEFNFWRLLGRLWPAALIIVGINMIFNQRRFGTVGQIGASAHSRMIGDLKLEFRGREIGDVNTSQMIGDVAIDLNGGSLRLGTNTLNISNVIGDTTVLIPASFSTKISAKAIVGDLRLDGRREEGIFPKLEYADDNYDQATDRLLVKIGGVIGDVGMQRT